MFIGQTGSLSVADLFRVVPLGVSPQENTPGYTLVDFKLTAAELKAALELGLNLGTSADAFWLGVSGARIEYDPGRAGLDQITKIELVATTETNPAADATAVYDRPLYDLANGGFSNSEALVRVSSNPFITLFAEGLGICPRREDNQPYPHCAPCIDNASCTEPGSVCNVPAGRCTGGSPVAFAARTMVPLSLGIEQELKEFLSLIGYLRRFLNDALPGVYNEPIPRRMCCVGPNCPTDGRRTCP